MANCQAGAPGVFFPKVVGAPGRGLPEDHRQPVSNTSQFSPNEQHGSGTRVHRQPIRTLVDRVRKSGGSAENLSRGRIPHIESIQYCHQRADNELVSRSTCRRGLGSGRQAGTIQRQRRSLSRHNRCRSEERFGVAKAALGYLGNDHKCASNWFKKKDRDGYSSSGVIENCAVPF